MGFKDERALSEDLSQPYGEIFVIRANGTHLTRLTDQQWEVGTPAWRTEPGRQLGAGLNRVR